MRRYEKNVLCNTSLRREEQYRVSNRDGLAEFNSRLASLETGAPLDSIVKKVSSATATRRLAAHGGGFTNISTLPQDFTSDIVSFGVLFPGDFDFTADCLWVSVNYNAWAVAYLAIIFTSTLDNKCSQVRLDCERNGRERYYNIYVDGVYTTGGALYINDAFVGALKHRFQKIGDHFYFWVQTSSGVWQAAGSITHRVFQMPLYLGTYTYDAAGERNQGGYRNFVLNSGEAIYVGV